MRSTFVAGVAFAIGLTSSVIAAESICFGTVSNGRLENSVKLPGEGNNFTSYSSLGATLGRTHVHSKVAQIVLAAYRALEQSAAGKVFVYGETGWSSGGQIRPHRTHQNGLSVDFMVPVVDAAGRSVPLPTHVSNKFGYNINFDVNAQYQGYTPGLSIDFEAIAEHIYQLDIASKAQDAGIALVIFDPPYLPKLFATKRGGYLKSHLKFLQRSAWVRHDEHYHVDFSIPCQAMRG